MDKLKAQLAAAAPYTFWAMCIGIVVASLASWWVSTSTLTSEQRTRLAEIESQFNSVSQLKKPQHPNPATIKGMDELNRSFAKDVADGWQRQYDQQAAVLVWPTSFDESFREKVDVMRPIESIPGPVTPIEFALPVENLQMYRNYILVDLPTLAQTIGTEWKATSAAGGGGGADGGGAAAGGIAGMQTLGGGAGSDTAIVDKSIVLWDASNQQELLQTHFGFTASTDLPTTLEVLYAQEDLWVLQNIMDIIKAANGDATARHEAAIKQVYFIRLGRSALGMAGEITPVGAAGSSGQGGGPPSMPGPGVGGGGAMAGMPGEGGAMAGMGAAAGGATSGGPPSMPGPGVGGGGAAMGETGGATSFADPADGRYVDEKYLPLQATRLRGALKSRTKADALLAVAKRVPVRLRFQVDQRRMNRVLAACGNSRLPVEIRQVRVNRDAAAGSGGGGSNFGGGGDMAGMMLPDAGGGAAGFAGAETLGGFGGAGGFGGSQTGGGRGMVKGSVVSDATVDPHLVDVELYGIVYIYNPVNKSQLGLDETTTTVMTAPPSSPAAPAAAPVSPAPPATGTPAAAVVPAGAAEVGSVAGS